MGECEVPAAGVIPKKPTAAAHHESSFAYSDGRGSRRSSAERLGFLLVASLVTLLLSLS